jgi:hypothetical protein
LWTRLEGYQPSELAELITARRTVRIGIMRNTLHLLTAEDCLRLWSLFQSLLKRRLQSSPFGGHLNGLDVKPVLAEAVRLMKAKPRTTAELGELLGRRWPDRDATSLAYAVRHLVPVVQVPPRGVWGKRAQATWSTAQLWLGRQVEGKPSTEQLILRYLKAFGPASVADIQA